MIAVSKWSYFVYMIGEIINNENIFLKQVKTILNHFKPI